MSAIVTNASSVKSLVVTRSLGRKVIKVTTTDNDRFSPTFFSKYSTHHFLSKDAEKAEADFIKTLLNQVKKRKTDVLIPVNSTETLLISKFKDKFTPFIKVPFQDYSTMMLANNKDTLMGLAAELNIRSPKSYCFSDAHEIRNLAKSLKYPQVIKLKDATSSVGISYVYSEEELIQKYKQTILKYNLHPSNYPIIQEYIPGNGYGVSTLFNKGDLRAIFVHKRLREYPITGGPSTLRESVRHPEMEKIAIKLLKHLNWHGVAMVEFKLDNRTNKPVLIEVNPRFWGSINQAVTSGVDFPYLLYEMAINGDVKPVLNYKLGIKTRFLINDFRALFGKLKSSENRFSVLREFFDFSYNNINDDAFSRDDILPAGLFIYKGLSKLFDNMYERSDHKSGEEYYAKKQ